MKFFFTLLIAFLTFSFGNGQNQTPFKDKKRVTNEKLLSQSQSWVKMAPERPATGKDLQKPNNSAVHLLQQNAELPVTTTGMFFETPVTMKSPSAATGSNILYGYRLNDQSFYSFSADNPESATVIKAFTDGANKISAGELVNGDYYLTSCSAIGNPANLLRLSTETWEVVSSIPVQQHALDMAYSYSTQTMYAITSSGEGSLLYTINLTTGASAPIEQLPVRFVGITVHLNGTLFGISVKGDLYTINKTTGALSLVGATGISPLVGENNSFTQSIGFDHNTGELYWAFVISSVEESGLYEVNTTTGEAIRKGFIGTGMQLIALGAPYYSYSNIPAIPTNFTITPEANGALSATLNWTNPALARNGNPLTELTLVNIERNGALVHTITNPAIGANTTWTDNVSQEDDYVYSVYGVTGGYSGTKVTKSAFIGNDACNVTSFPLIEGFERAGVPDCWTSIYYSEVNKPEPNETTAHSGKQSWRFSSELIQKDDHHAFLISPRLAVTSRPKTLQFYYNTLNYTMEIFRVGYSTTNSNPNSFVWVDQIGYKATNGWVEYNNKELPAETKFIAIEYLSMYKWYVYIDDITIDQLQDNDVAVAAVLSPKSGPNLTAGETVTVSIKNNGTESVSDIPVKFEIDGVVKGTESIAGPIVGQTSVSYTFTAKADLHELKSYWLKAYTAWESDVRPENDTVSIKVTNFGDCVASLPLTEGFEDISDLACWTVGYDPGKENRPGTAQIARTGKQSWAFSSLNEESDQFLMTPELPVGSGKSKSIQFYVNNPTHAIETEELFQIGYSTTDKEISSFKWSGDTWVVEFTNGWLEFIAPAIPAAAKYICIHYFSAYQDHLYIDDLTVREISDTDVALTAIVAPVSGNDLSNKEKVTVRVRNAGTQSVSDVPVAFELNGKLVGSGTVPGSIASSQEKIFTFNATVDLSTVNTYTIKAYTGLSGDLAYDNDTLSAQITNTGICKITEFPYTEGFENPFGSCWSFYNLDGNFYGWERSTVLARTGAYSVYHGGGPGEENGWLVSPKIAVPADRTLGLYFWSYNAFGVSDYGKNSVWISTGSPNPSSGDFVEIWTPSDPVPYEWGETGLNLGNYKGKDIYIAFRYEGYLDHTCFLDDISIIDISDLKDAGITAITYPLLNSGDMGKETVKIKVKNFGGQPLIDLPVKFEVNNVPVANEKIQEKIESLQEISYNFTTPADLSREGTYTIKVYTALEGDVDASNNAESVTVTNYGVCEVSSFPYLENFEREADYFICWNVYNPDGDARTWTPASTLGAQVIPAHSGSLVALHEDYAYNQDGWLVSPKINIPSEDIYQLSFWTFTAWPDWYSEEVTKAKSSVWISTGSSDPASKDFKEVWSAKTVVDDWREVKINLRKYAGQPIYVAFRYEGEDAHAWFLDDVSVSELTGLDAGISEIIMPAAGEITAATPVKVKITNFGAEPLTSVPVAYICNEGTPVTETFTGDILSGDSVEYTFKQTLDMSKFGFYRLKAYTSLSGDSDAGNDEASLFVAYPQDIELYGYRLYSTDFASVNDFRTVKFSLYNPSELTWVGNPYIDDENNIVAAGEFLDKKIYVFTQNYGDASPGNFVRLTSNWEEEAKMPVSQVPIDMTYDYYNGTMYAITSEGSSSLPVTLKEVNLSTGELTTVAELDYYLYTLAANLNGDLYGVDVDGNLVTIDKQSGVTRVINNLGVYPAGNQSMTFDHNSKPERLFWAMYVSVYRQGRLIEIDPVSGKSFSSGPIGENAQIVALYAPYPAGSVKINFPESDDNAVRMYPNPAQEEVYLTSVPEKSQIRILDLSGRTVFSDDKQSGKVTLNLNLKAGVYMVVIENEGKKTMRKLIIK
jgi:hypothetical protein